MSRKAPLLTFLCLLVSGTVLLEIAAHQQPSFPGQNANQPPQAHHQAHAQQAQQQAQQGHQQPNQATFGGEQAKDEG